MKQKADAGGHSFAPLAQPSAVRLCLAGGGHYLSEAPPHFAEAEPP